MDHDLLIFYGHHLLTGVSAGFPIVGDPCTGSPPELEGLFRARLADDEQTPE